VNSKLVSIDTLDKYFDRYVTLNEFNKFHKNLKQRIYGSRDALNAKLLEAISTLDEGYNDLTMMTMMMKIKLITRFFD